MSEETKKHQEESELSDEQLEEAVGGGIDPVPFQPSDDLSSDPALRPAEFNESDFDQQTQKVKDEIARG